MSLLLKANTIMTLTAPATSAGAYWFIGNPGDEPGAYNAVSSGGVATVGPFNVDKNYATYNLTATVVNEVAYDPTNVNITGGVVSGTLPLVTTMAASGAITIQPGVVKITKSSALAALTLAAPTAAQDGLEILVTSTTAKAHTITATTLINDGVTGGAKTTATFAAFAGASIRLVAMDQAWNVVSSNNVTIA